MRSLRRLAVTLTLSLMSPLLVGAARAQPRSEPVEYHFTDDHVLGSTLSGNLAILKVRPRPLRVTLIRPRASFVAELLTSCENM